MNALQHAAIMRVRHMQEVFMAAVAVLAAVAAHAQGAEAICSQAAAVRQLGAVCQVLARKVDTEQRYLLRLEGDVRMHK